MIIKIHKTAVTPIAVLYNEAKVKAGVATYFHSANTLMINPFLYDQNHRLKILQDIEKTNLTVKKKCLHISINPSISDRMIMNDKTIRLEIDQMMQYMGYGQQPYFVYQHKDLERLHYHIVSTRIDKLTSKRIKCDWDYLKMRRFIQRLETKYDLNQVEPKSQLEQKNFTLNTTCSDLRARVEGIFRLLNQSKGIENETMYHEILRAFSLEIYRSERGAVVHVKNNEGKIIRNPMKMSAIKERIKIQDPALAPDKELLMQVEERVSQSISELFKKYRFCDLLIASRELKEKGLYLFRSSETEGYKIYSFDEKTVFSDPNPLNKQLNQLDYFNLTNQDFFAIIKDYNRVLSEKFHFVSEGLIDYQKLPLLELKNVETNLAFKEIILSESKEFSRLSFSMDDLSKGVIRTAIKDYYSSSIQKIIEMERLINKYDFYREYHDNRGVLKPGLTSDLIKKYNMVKTGDQVYLSNHPSGIQEVSLNPEQLKFNLEAKSLFAEPILETLRLMPWYNKNQEQNDNRQMLKQDQKGSAIRL
jgi:hypothetical protein